MANFLHRPLQDIYFQSHMVTSRPRGWKNESRKQQSSAEMSSTSTRVPETGREQRDIPSPAHPWHQCALPSVRNQRQSLIFWDTRAGTSLLPEKNELLRQLDKWNWERSLEKNQPKSFKKGLDVLVILLNSSCVPVTMDILAFTLLLKGLTANPPTSPWGIHPLEISPVLE